MATSSGMSTLDFIARYTCNQALTPSLSFIHVTCTFLLKEHGDAQTQDSANIDFLHDFHIFYKSYEKMNF